jgi:ribosomal protein S18 acetylase RimI-like enzyme
MRTVDPSRSPQLAAVTLQTISPADRDAFLEMAGRHFRELNPDFVPQEDWKQHYFDRIQGNPRLSLRWVLADGHPAGFILFGTEDHAFLPRRSGIVYELYIAPEFRRRGIARACAQQAIDELQSQAPSKVQLEIMENNRGAAALWSSLGFEKVSERWVLRKSRT